MYKKSYTIVLIMNQELQIQIQAAFDKATTGIRELENLLRDNFENPMRDFNSLEFRKIQLPPSYIRSKYHFLTTYNLRDLIDDTHYGDSIAYSLMQTDFNNYILNRVHIWGITKNLFFKFAIINNSSIIEALLICSFTTTRRFCAPADNVCKYNSKCDFYIKSTKNMGVKSAINLFFGSFAIEHQDLKQDFLDIMDIRDKVHLSLIEESEFHTTLYSVENYNKSVNILRFLRDNQLTLFQDFNKSRWDGCISLPF